jgi:hypothetical protein
LAQGHRFNFALGFGFARVWTRFYDLLRSEIFPAGFDQISLSAQLPGLQEERFSFPNASPVDLHIWLV